MIIFTADLTDLTDKATDTWLYYVQRQHGVTPKTINFRPSRFSIIDAERVARSPATAEAVVSIDLSE